MCSNIYKTIRFNTKENNPKVSILIGKVSILRILFKTEFISQNNKPRIPKMIYVSLYMDSIVNQSSGI